MATLQSDLQSLLQPDLPTTLPPDLTGSGPGGTWWETSRLTVGAESGPRKEHRR
jgi:hypothetical protein